MKDVVVQMDAEERIEILEREVGRLTAELRARDRIILKLAPAAESDDQAEAEADPSNVTPMRGETA